ncbi:LAMI_0H01926g1_1 [Lachancea mirantina]|uniref:LAMI_0H01926g1_1 n=1 Tax=Lachancea mirantina TaxID=1230905 RepID=A0A1G4KDU1_9SACH|nr:LAMI_0H01926g1_1 [Lachancea mirantina]
MTDKQFAEGDNNQQNVERTNLIANGENHPIVQADAIPDSNIEYISPDAELTKELPVDIERMDLVHLRIRSMEDLDLYRFTKLKELCLRQNLIESMSEVDVLPACIEDIDLYDNKIKHISSNVNKLTNLTNLDLSFNKIKHIKNLERLVKLENLYFVQNKISKIENLGTLTKLKNLELGGNKIETIGPNSFEGLGNLQEIWLGKNSISRLNNLQHLKSLRILSIQSNRLKTIEGLETLENLEELYLSHNFIRKIEGLEKNRKLTTLDITSNKLTKVENLKHLTNLTDLWLSFNQIDQSFESLGEELRELPMFETIYLEGNPIQTQNETAYRRKLVLNLGPSLQKIDATYIRG